MSEVTTSEAQASLTSLKDLHLADPELFAGETILPIFERLRSEAPVHHCADSPYGPYWSILRDHDIQKVDQDHEHFSSDARLGGVQVDDSIVGDPEGDFFVCSFITTDPPSHGPIRKAVNGIVRPQGLQSFEPIIRERAARTLNSLPVGEVFDWVPAVSIELTTQMLASLFDFPFEERYRLTRWSDVTTAEEGSPIIESPESRIAELVECLHFFKALKAERRDGPPKLDLVTMLAQDAATKDQPDAEFLGNLMLLIVGGNDTTRNTMSGSINAFHQYPQQLAALKANPLLLGFAVSEIIRWQTPLSHMRRTALADVEVGGQTIRKGDKVVMWYYSGNRDTDVFDNPNAVDITRSNVRQHSSFGFGVHRCLGMRLAEMQLKILWQEILKRWSNIEVVEPPQRVYSNFVNGYEQMMVKIHR